MIGAPHDLVLRTLGAVTVDAEGRTTRAPATDVTVRGSVDELSARDVEIAAQVGQRHDIAVRVPLDVDVDVKTQAIVTEPSTLAGTYEVDTIRTLRTHYRLLCSKVEA